MFTAVSRAYKPIVLFLLLLALILSGCAQSAPTPTPQPTMPLTPTPAPTPAPVVIGPSVNLTDGCADRYEPDVDYFPKKVTLRYAEGFTVEYHENYKVVTVTRPWRNAETTFRYVLVQCGTPAPTGYEDAQVIQVPVKRIVTLSTTHLPALSKLGLLDRLVGVGNFKYVNSLDVRALIDAGFLEEVGSGAKVDVEKVVALDPDLVLTFGIGNPERDAHPKLLEAGLKVAINAEYMEGTPLGRSEWIKFIALFFNKEKDAERIFDGIVRRYQAIRDVGEKAEERPTVFAGYMYKGTWYMPGGKSYVAQFLRDAGATYLWAEDETAGSIPLDFEAVYERAADADFWVNVGRAKSLKDLAEADERYTQFKAFQEGNVYNNNKRLNKWGGNDYWESGLANPDIVLADLVSIFHPDLLPQHDRVYYQQLK